MYDEYDDNERIVFSARNPRRDVHREVELRIRERMSRDSNLSYTDAMRATFAADQNLHQAYLDNAPPLRQHTNRE